MQEMVHVQQHRLHLRHCLQPAGHCMWTWSGMFTHGCLPGIWCMYTQFYAHMLEMSRDKDIALGCMRIEVRRRHMPSEWVCRSLLAKASAASLHLATNSRTPLHLRRCANPFQPCHVSRCRPVFYVAPPRSCLASWYPSVVTDCKTCRKLHLYLKKTVGGTPLTWTAILHPGCAPSADVDNCIRVHRPTHSPTHQNAIPSERHYVPMLREQLTSCSCGPPCRMARSSAIL